MNVSVIKSLYHNLKNKATVCIFQKFVEKDKIVYFNLTFYSKNFRIHKPSDSIFSWNSGFNNYEGVVNWGFLLLTMGGVRLGLENLNK